MHEIVPGCVQIQKAVKKSARREQLQREETEQRRLKSVLELQYLLDQLGEDGVRQDLKHPDASGAPLLTDAELSSLDEFYKLVGPERNYDVRYARTCVLSLVQKLHLELSVLKCVFFNFFVLNPALQKLYTTTLCN